MSIMRSASVVEWWDRLTKQAPNRKSWRRQCDLASHVHAYNVFVSCYSVVLLCAFVPVSVLIRIPEQMNWSIDRLTDWAVGDESSRAVCRGQRPTQVYQRIVCLGASASGNRGGPNPQFFYQRVIQGMRPGGVVDGLPARIRSALYSGVLLGVRGAMPPEFWRTFSFVPVFIR